MQIEMAYAGLELIGHAPHPGAAASGEHFDVDAEAFLEIVFELLAQLRARRNRHRDLAFLAAGIDELVPFS